MLFKKMCAEKLALCEEIVAAFSVLQDDFPVEIVNVNNAGFLLVFKDFPSGKNSFSIGDNFFTTEPEALLERLFYECRLFLSIEYSREKGLFPDDFEELFPVIEACNYGKICDFENNIQKNLLL